MSLCHRCRRCAPSGGDSWCLGCTAGEALSNELSGSWHSAAIRALANEVCVSAVKHVRALRQLSSSLQSAETSRASLSRASTPKAEPARAGNHLPVPPPPPPKVVKEQSSSSGDTEESEGSGERASSHHKEDKTPARAEGSSRTVDHRGDKRAREHSSTAAETPRKEHRHREERDRRRHKKSGHRAGRKHQRLHHTLENPNLIVHYRPPANYWDYPQGSQGRLLLDPRK